MSQTISDIARAHLPWALVGGIGPIRFSRLLERLGGAEQARSASAGDLSELKGIGRETADAIVRGLPDACAAAEREIADAAAIDARILCREDPDYPALLRQIPDAPIALYVRGELRPTDAIAVAVVGSRRCSIYGSEQARRFGELLAQAGFTVVSGLARGIDAFAHHGALDGGGRTIAVMGCGLMEIYPPENAVVAQRILSGGAWVSELPLRTVVRSSNFLPRNRIIAGMSLGTLVVEAALRSGALTTARLAGEDYNREVFAIPGRVQDPMSLGCNAMIRAGKAKLVTCLEDILDELGEVGQRLGVAFSAPLKPAASAAQAELLDESDPGAADGGADAQTAMARLAPTEARVYGCITDEPQLQELIFGAAKLPVGDILAAITSLELKGLVRRLPGQMIVRRSSR